YNDIFKINDYFYDGGQGRLILDAAHGSFDKYCDYNRTSDSNKCLDYFEMASSGVFHLLKNYNKYGLGHDKLAEYAILFLSYKLNQSKKNTSKNLSDFYTNYIEKNKYYNEKINDDTTTYKDIIDKKINLLNIKEISKFNDPFGMLLSLYYLVHLKKLDCKKCSQNAEKFVQKIVELNEDSNNTVDSSYNKLLSTLSNDYKNLINKCPDFKSLSKIEPKKNPVEDPGKVSGPKFGETSEVTSSSSSITSKLIPVLLILGAIPIFFGIAYKYSLFGFDKLFQRQYIRKKLKKFLCCGSGLSLSLWTPYSG
ncbi:cir2 protein, partial [Plasmodium yoelii yoelii]